VKRLPPRTTTDAGSTAVSDEDSLTAGRLRLLRPLLVALLVAFAVALHEAPTQGVTFSRDYRPQIEQFMTPGSSAFCHCLRN
jgi:hypothetical protein